MELDLPTNDVKLGLVEDTDEHFSDIMEEELGEILEKDVLDSDSISEDMMVKEIEENIIDGLDDLDDVDTKFAIEAEISKAPEIQEDVFDSWDDAEDAFMNFERESQSEEKSSGFSEIDGIEFDNFDDGNEDPEINESYRFTENELKEIVTVSVQKALEKSIASSLVELAVSELKSHVTQMDQS